MYASQEETGLRRSGAPLNRRRPPPAGAGELGGGPWPCMGPRRLGGVGAPRPHLPRHEAMGHPRHGDHHLLCLPAPGRLHAPASSRGHLPSQPRHLLADAQPALVGPGAMTGALAPPRPAELDRPPPRRGLPQPEHAPGRHSGAGGRWRGWRPGPPPRTACPSAALDGGPPVAGQDPGRPFPGARRRHRRRGARPTPGPWSWNSAR